MLEGFRSRGGAEKPSKTLASLDLCQQPLVCVNFLHPRCCCQALKKQIPSRQSFVLVISKPECYISPRRRRYRKCQASHEIVVRDILMEISSDKSNDPGRRRAESGMTLRKKDRESHQKPVSLKILADYLGLCPATVSVVLNNVPGRSIPAETRERVRPAAQQFNYQPSLLARSLRKQRTFTVGVLVPELSDGYHTLVMSGIGDHLMREGYFYFSAHHRHKPDMIEEYPRLLLGCGGEGIVTIHTALTHELPISVVAVAGHRTIAGVTNVIVDHRRSAGVSLLTFIQLFHAHTI